MAMAVVEVKVILKVELSQFNCQAIVCLALYLKNVMVQQLARIFPYPSNLISEKSVWNRASKGAYSRFCLSLFISGATEEMGRGERKGKREGVVCCLLSAVWMSGKAETTMHVNL
jgi:hypothetical protein